MPVVEYLARARECADLADRAGNPEDRKKLLEIASAWAELAKAAAEVAATQSPKTDGKPANAQKK
jgi:hypothetical protein